MKVLYLIDSLKGYGAEKSLCDIIIRFTRVTPVMVQIFEGNDLVDYLEKHGVKVYSLELDDKLSPGNAVLEIRKIVELENPQIIHSTLLRAELVGRKLKTIFPTIKLVGSFVSNSYSKRRFELLTLVSKIKLLSTQIRDRWTAHRVDCFISNSEAIKLTNARALDIPEERITTIYRGRKISADKAINEIPADLAHLKGGNVFLNVGRLQPSKGHDSLITAFEKVVAFNSNSALLIAGDGSYGKELEKLIDKMGLGNNIFLLGYRKDIPQLLELANYFIFPSYFEGLSGALIEAIISRTPLIISDIPENRECIPRDAALLFLPGAIEEMAEKMIEAMQTTNWSRKTELAFQFALENFEIEKVSKKYEEFYLNLQNNSASKAV